MRHVHYDDRAGGRVPEYTAWSAYVRLLAGVLGAVVLTTAFWAGWANHQLYVALIRRAMVPADLQGLLGTLWGVELTGNIAVDSLLFAFSRLTSPFVLAVVVIAGIAAFVVSRL